MYRLIEWIRVLALPSMDNNQLNSEMNSINNGQSTVHRNRHTKYFQRCLDVLPPRVASHDTTR